MDKTNAADSRVANENDITLKEKSADDDVTYDVRCGYGSCKPRGLQVCNNPKILLAIICVFAVSQGKTLYFNFEILNNNSDTENVELDHDVDEFQCVYNQTPICAYPHSQRHF